MKIYVPEIGDHIVLIKDWTFGLHAENRNEQLGALFGHYLNHAWRNPESGLVSELLCGLVNKKCIPNGDQFN